MIKIVIITCILGMIKFLFSMFKKRKEPFAIDAVKQKEINKIFDEKIEEARKENEKPLTEEDIVNELNRYRNLN